MLNSWLDPSGGNQFIYTPLPGILPITSGNTMKTCHSLPGIQILLSLMHPFCSPAPTKRSVYWQIPADFCRIALSDSLQENLQWRDGDLVWVCPLLSNFKAALVTPEQGLASWNIFTACLFSHTSIGRSCCIYGNAGRIHFCKLPAVSGTLTQAVCLCKALLGLVTSLEPIEDTLWKKGSYFYSLCF